MVEGIATVLTLRFSSTLELIGLGEGVEGNFFQRYAHTQSIDDHSVYANKNGWVMAILS